MAHKAGFVNIIGNPNVGKSTLMNAMVGEKLSIITPKAQTTRHRIMGILNEEDYQIVFSDTPGILETHYKLHESMMKFVESSFQDADIFLFVTSIDETFNNDIVLQRLQKAEIPVFLLLNKIDLSEQSIVENSINEWAKKLPNAEIIPVSALHKFNLDRILKSIIEKLPENPPYYSKDELTDKPQKFFVSEIIREKIFLYYSQEIPYCTEVEIESYKEEKAIVKIRSIIYVTRDSQKGILIGNRGEALKKNRHLGTKRYRSIYWTKSFFGNIC